MTHRGGDTHQPPTAAPDIPIHRHREPVPGDRLT
jgi:hypothetical protein